MNAVTDPALVGWAVAALLGGGWLVVRWLVGRFARQYEALEAQARQLDRQMLEVQSRLTRLEKDVANDKAGRAAFADAVGAVRALAATVEHLARTVETLKSDIKTEFRDVWSRLNRLADRSDAA